jgi:FkbM family methyltransferase
MMKLKKLLYWIYALIFSSKRFQLMQWLWKCARRPDEISTFTLSDGSKFCYPLNSAIGRSLYVGSFETAELSFVDQSLKEGDTFFDIGANGGIFTITAARKIGNSGHVYAFEPGQRELELLRHNIQLNNLSNVTVVESAVGDLDGIVEFVVSHDGALNSIKETKHPAQSLKEKREVNITRLDSYIAANHIYRVDFIKVDVEGAEKLVFEGASELLSQMQPTILFEASEMTSKAFGYSPIELFKKLRTFGFTVNSIDDGNRLTPVLDNDEAVLRSYNFIALKGT